MNDRAPRIPTSGVGLGLRWEFLEEVLDGPEVDVAFFEVAPENYMRRGGYYPAALERLGRRYPLVTHGLTLSIGADAPPDHDYVAELANEVARLDSPWHSDHLALTGGAGRIFHELLPLKFSRDVAYRVAERLEALADALGRPVAIENITYYAHAGRSELSESDFLHTLFEHTRAGLLFDVNNVYVNAQNHGFDAREALAQLPLERAVELHVAGHTRTESGLLIDTHGAPVSPAVLDLLAATLERTGPLPVLLERDNFVPELSVLLDEVRSVRDVVERALTLRDHPHDDEPEAFGVVGVEHALAELVLGPALVESELAALCARHALTPDDSAALASEFEHWLVYRKLVQSTLRDAVTLAIPRTSTRLGALFDEYFERFLAENGPRTHYLRDVTSELLDFCAPLWAADARVPPWALELARHEAVQIVVASLREPAVPAELGALDLERGLRFVEAARIVRYAFAVHRLSADEADRTPPERVPSVLLVYRDPAHDVRYLELSPLAAALLERLLAGASLKDALLDACSASGLEPGAALEGSARLLADLAERGVVLGPAPDETPRVNLRAGGESSIMAEFGRDKETHERT